MGDENELYQLVNANLLELARYQNFPLNERFALSSFLFAFADRGYSVDFYSSNNSFEISWDDSHGPYHNPFKTTIGSERILKGKNNFPKSSLSALAESARIVYEGFASRFFGGARINEDSYYDFVRDESDAYYNYVLPRIEEKLYNYQEFVFAPIGKKPAEPKPPQIFYKVLENFDLDLYSEAINGYPGEYCESEDIMPSDLYRYGVEGFRSEGILPSQFSLEDYFVGMYLYGLSRQKGYEPEYGAGIDDFMDCGIEALRPFGRYSGY